MMPGTIGVRKVLAPFQCLSLAAAAACGTLSAMELDAAREGARQVHVSDLQGCGADKPELRLTIASSSGRMDHGDDFYACEKQHPAYVEGESLDELYRVLSALVK